MTEHLRPSYRDCGIRCWDIAPAMGLWCSARGRSRPEWSLSLDVAIVPAAAVDIRMKLTRAQARVLLALVGRP